MKMDYDAVRAAWSNGAGGSHWAFQTCRRPMLGGALGDLGPAVEWADGELRGLFGTGTQVLGETQNGMEACIATFKATDHDNAGTFDGVRMP